MAKIYANIDEILTVRVCPRKLALKLMGVKVRKIEYIERKREPYEIGKLGENVVEVAIRHILTGEPIETIMEKKKIEKTNEFESLFSSIFDLVSPYISGFRKIERGIIKSSVTQTIHRPDFVLTDDVEATIVEVKNTRDKNRKHFFQTRFYMDVHNIGGSTIIGSELLSVRRAILVYPRLRLIFTNFNDRYQLYPSDIASVHAVKLLVNYKKIPEEKGNCTKCLYRKICAKVSSKLRKVSLEEARKIPPELFACKEIAKRYGNTILDELYQMEKSFREKGIIKRKQIDIDVMEVVKILQENFKEWNIKLETGILFRNTEGMEMFLSLCSPHFYPKRSIFFIDKAIDVLKRKEKRKTITLEQFF